MNLRQTQHLPQTNTSTASNCVRILTHLTKESARFCNPRLYRGSSRQNFPSPEENLMSTLLTLSLLSPFPANIGAWDRTGALFVCQVNSREAKRKGGRVQNLSRMAKSEWTDEASTVPYTYTYLLLQIVWGFMGTGSVTFPNQLMLVRRWGRCLFSVEAITGMWR